jgi:peptidyl-prolyl cis-trans isomerase D
MLQKLRDKTSGWIAAAILVLLIIPFAFFGVENYFTQQVSTYVAKVNDAEIGQDIFRERFEQQRARMRQIMGEQFDARGFDTPESRREVLDQLIDEEVLRQAAERLGIVVAPSHLQKEIAAVPAFQTDGKFDASVYRAVLQSQGMTPKSFQEMVFKQLSTQMVPGQISESGFVTADYVSRFLALRDQTRSFDYVVLPAPAADQVGEITDAQLQEYYDAHADRYVSEERLSLEYIELDSSKLDVPVVADESTLRQRYEEQKSRYVEPEQRLASHMLVAVAANADADAQKAAQAKAQDLVTKARAEDADFAALAKANSDDPGSKNTGGDLGWIEKGITDPAFETALYAMQAGTISDPVKGADGWHVIQLREIKAEAGKPFEEVRAELEREYLDGERERLFSDLSSKLVDVIYKDPTTLATAAEELDLPVQRSESFTRDAGTGIAMNPAVRAAAFSDAVLANGTVSDPIDLGNGHSVVIRAVDHVAAAPQALDQVRDAVRAAIQAERIATRSKEDAEAALAKLRGGESLESIAGARQLEVKKADKVGRMGATVDPAITQYAFGLEHPAASKPTLGEVALPDGSHALVALTEVVDGDPAKTDEATRTTMSEQLGQAIGGAEATAFVQALRKSATIEVVEERL